MPSHLILVGTNLDQQTQNLAQVEFKCPHILRASKLGSQDKSSPTLSFSGVYAVFLSKSRWCQQQLYQRPF